MTPAKKPDAVPAKKVFDKEFVEPFLAEEAKTPEPAAAAAPAPKALVTVKVVLNPDKAGSHQHVTAMVETTNSGKEAVTVKAINFILGTGQVGEIYIPPAGMAIQSGQTAVKAATVIPYGPGVHKVGATVQLSDGTSAQAEFADLTV